MYFDVQSDKSPEFADYVASFGESPVPAKFQLLYGRDGEAKGFRLESVGNWPATKLKPNDRLLGVSYAFRALKPGAEQHVRHNDPADCFPLRNK